MKSFDIDPIIANILKIVERHRLENGAYARWLWQPADGSRDLGINAYGCADAANILYSLHSLPGDPAERGAQVRTLQGLQDPETGLFVEGTLTVIHTTAHCAGALDLFDAVPLHPYAALEKYKEPQELYGLLAEYNAHKGAGIYAAFANAGQADRAWSDAYFTWLDTHCDPETGMWCPKDPAKARPAWWCMGDTFHYLFNHEYARIPFPYPERLIDSCLKMRTENALPEHFGKMFHFIEVDWVYCMNRASRKTAYRFEEVHECLARFAEEYMAFLAGVDWMHDEHANDLHMLFGGVCCIAELQQALPGMIRSTVPLRLVLDRRPFI